MLENKKSCTHQNICLGARGSLCVDFHPLQIFPINFFKDKGSEKIAIALIMNNQGSGSGLKSFAKSIDNIESLTGIGFVSGLSDSIENKLKSTINTSS